MSQISLRQVRMLSEVITEDPSVVVGGDWLLCEWDEVVDPVDRRLMVVLDGGVVRRVGVREALAELRFEFESFARMYKMGVDRALEAFVKYKSTGESPGPSRGEAARMLSQRGGSDFRNDVGDVGSFR